MEKLRKSLKAYVIALVLFVALTFALAALVNLQDFVRPGRLGHCW